MIATGSAGGGEERTIKYGKDVFAVPDFNGLTRK